jgi:hypothetical protein
MGTGTCGPAAEVDPQLAADSIRLLAVATVLALAFGRKVPRSWKNIG